MKKINLLLTIFVFSALVNYAQVTRSVGDYQHYRLINALLTLSGPKTANKTTLVSQRLVSATSYGYDPSYGAWNRLDTTVYKYTEGRGSDFDFNAMDFLRYQYPYGYGPSGFDIGLVQVIAKNYSNRPFFQYSSAKTRDNNNALNDSSHVEYNADNDITYCFDTSLGYTSGNWRKAFNPNYALENKCLNWCSNPNA